MGVIVGDGEEKRELCEYEGVYVCIEVEKGIGMGDNELGKRAEVQSVLGPDDGTNTVSK